MSKESREGALRIDQRKDESADFWLMRAFLKALPHLNQNEALAATRWMYEFSGDPKMTETTPRTDATSLAIERGRKVAELERSLARKDALLREIHAALGWRQKNMKARIERELKGE